MTNREEAGRLWSYVHGELSDEEHAAVEQAVAADAALKAELKRIHALDQSLRMLMRSADWTDDQLQDEALRAWEAERETVEQEQGSRQGEIPFPRRRVFPVTTAWRRYAATAVALAAILLAIFGLASLQRGPIRWNGPYVLSESLRDGQPDAGTRRYSRAELQAVFADLKEAVETGYDAWIAAQPDGTSARHPWRLRVEFRELADGGVSLRVLASRGRTGPGAEFARHYPDLAVLREQAPTFGSRVLEGLTRPHEIENETGAPLEGAGR